MASQSTSTHSSFCRPELTPSSHPSTNRRSTLYDANHQAKSKRLLPPTGDPKGPATPTPVDNGFRELVCAVRGLQGPIWTIRISADAFIHNLTEVIHQQNASQLVGVSPSSLDAYYTYDPRLGWARMSESGGMIGRGDPLPKAFLVPTKRVRDYFQPNIPPWSSGVVHVVVDFFVPNMVGSQVMEIGAIPLAGDKPLPCEKEGCDIECARYGRVQALRELGPVEYGFPATARLPRRQVAAVR